MSKTIKITKQAGEIHNRDYILERINAALNLLSNGEHILTLKKDVKHRSLPQNALLWMWIECISRETGEDKMAIHDYLCTRFLRRTVTVNGKESTVISGTSKLNKEQFTNFLDKVHAEFASEYGIRLPWPEDLHFEDFINEYERYL